LPNDALPTAAIDIKSICDGLDAAIARGPASGNAEINFACQVLSAIPDTQVSSASVEALLKIARHYFFASQPMAGTEPALDAERQARVLGSQPLLRKALTARGLLLTETANLPDATRCFSEALELAQSTEDVRAEIVVWNNLGVLLMQASMTADAAACFERVVEISANNDVLVDLRAGALGNAALAALFERDFGRAYVLCREALAHPVQGVGPDAAYSRAIREAVFARVLIALNELDRAREHANLARQFATESKMPRAEVAAETALGLVEVESNMADIGLSRIQRMTELARAKVRSYLSDTLTSVVSAYERAGQPDVALVYLHELLALNKESRGAYVLMHHQQHVARLSRVRDNEPDAVDNQLRWQQGTLRGKLATADRERIKNLGQLVEQQALAAERLDDTTGEHCYRVGRLASILGHEVDLEEDVCFLIDLAARLHDIGKLIVPDAILLKPGKLSPGEREIMETHTVAGWEILGQTNIPQMHIAQEIARHHHERWDGTGYPDRMSSTAIPIAARVTALADVFDALTHVRPYKEAWPVADALAEIKRLRSRQFDPELTDVFLDLVPRLQREHGDLDRFLAAEAKHSPFIQARERIARALKGTNPDVSVFELRR